MKIEISPTCILMGLVLLHGNAVGFLATLLAMLFHEAGHLLAARMLHIKVERLSFDVFGARITPRGLFSYKKEAVLAAGGPAASLLLGLWLLPLGGGFPTPLALSSLSLGVFNLLPIDSFDGGRILHGILAGKCRAERASKILALTSYLSLLFLFLLASCVLLRFGENLAIAVLCAYLFAQIFLRGNEKSTAHLV